MRSFPAFPENLIAVSEYAAGDLAGDAAAQENMEKAADDFKSAGTRVVLESPESSVRQQLQVIDGLKPEDNGRFLAHNGPSFV